MSTLERLDGANPVPDPDRLLSSPGAMDSFVFAVKERSGIAHIANEAIRGGVVRRADDSAPIQVPPVTQTEQLAEPPTQFWRRRWKPALVAFVAVVLVGGSIGLFTGGRSGPFAATTTAPTTTLPPRVGGSVTIETLVFEAGNSPSPFTISGTADICSEGDALNIAHNETDSLRTFTDRYTCADGSGTFDLSAEFPQDPDAAQVSFDGEGTWTISGGTGDYANLEGGGTSVSEFGVLWTETHTGELRYGPP